MRVIASTNRDLAAEIAAGRFREDCTTGWRSCRWSCRRCATAADDVQLLAEHFLERAAQRLSRPRLELADDARELLAAYHWPGNVRELENLITRACVLNQGERSPPAEIRPWLQQPERVGANDGGNAAAGELAGARLDDMERATIVATLQKFGGNRAKTAAALGIGVRTLSGKLRAYGFAPRTREFATSATASCDRQNLPMRIGRNCRSRDAAKCVERVNDARVGRSGEVTETAATRRFDDARLSAHERQAARHAACLTSARQGSRRCLTSMFDNSTLPMLEQVVNFTQARHGVLAGNIANLDTPGYRARDLSPQEFQERLKDGDRGAARSGRRGRRAVALSPAHVDAADSRQR